MKNKIATKDAIYIILISLLPVFFIWLPFLSGIKNLFFLKLKPGGFFNIIANWDGPNYLVVAKTWYNLAKISKMGFVNPPIYYTAHFPLFPFFIYLFHFVFGWLKAGVVTNVLFGLSLNFLFYFLARKHTKHPLFLTLIFTVFPARFLVTRVISAPETLMLSLILLSIMFFDNEKYLLSSIFGSLAVLTKIQSLFLFFAYLAVFFEMYIRDKKLKKGYLWTLLMPLSLLGLFSFYWLRVGNFFAFFTAEKGNNLFVHFPFAQFNYLSHWGGSWLEDVVFYIMGMILLTVSLWKTKYRAWFYFVLFYSLFLIVTPQRDITRFSYSILPFFLFRFEKFFTSKIFKWTLFLSLPAIYFYVVNFILVNQAPIVNLGVFVK